MLSKAYDGQAVEVNYKNTWKDGRLGILLFTIEDMYAGPAILQAGVRQMGVIPCIAYDGNILTSLGLGTQDEEGDLVEDTTCIGVRALVKLVEITCKYAGIWEPAAVSA